MHRKVHDETGFEDLGALLELLEEQKIKPLVAKRCPLAEARLAHELLGKEGVTGKIVLVTQSQPGGAGGVHARSQ